MEVFFMKRIAFILMATALVSLLSCTRESSDSFVLKFNTVAGPQQAQVKALEVFAREAAALSDGKIEVRIFHSGQLGNQQTQVVGVMRGSLEMTFTAPNSLAQFDKALGIFGAAYLFRDLMHMEKVMSGPIGRGYFEALAREQGLRPLGSWYLGTRQLNLRDREVHTPEDMKGLKLRMPNSPQWIAMGKALGANPTPLGFNEVYLALKTGVVDGQDNPLPTDKAQKFYEVTKYIILTSHQMGMVWPTINEKTWQSMPDEYRKWILQALEKARRYHDGLVLKGEADLIREFRDEHGMVIIEPDVEAFRRHAREVYREFEGEWGEGVYERIQAVE
jgi:tripartite ATP-independent transporter DctP family solute receptor